MHFPQIDQRYVNEFLALIEVGATPEQAIQQIALSNEVEPSQVQVELEVA